MKYLSLLLLAISISTFAASDKGSVSVNGQTLEVEVQRVYAPGAAYPRSALRRGIEGYVVVEFDVSPEGEVLDPYVVDTDKPGSFERASESCLLYTSPSPRDPT